MDDKYGVSIMWEDDTENDSSHGPHVIAWFVHKAFALQYARWQYGMYASWATFVQVDVRVGEYVLASYRTP